MQMVKKRAAHTEDALVRVQLRLEGLSRLVAGCQIPVLFDSFATPRPSTLLQQLSAMLRWRHKRETPALR